MMAMAIPSFLKAVEGWHGRPARSDGAGRAAVNRPAHHPLWNGARRASNLMCPELRPTAGGPGPLIQVRPEAPVLPKLSRANLWAVDPLTNIIGVRGGVTPAPLPPISS